MSTFLDGDPIKMWLELKESLERTLNTTNKSVVRACYPREGYDNAEVRMQIIVNLEGIRESIYKPNTVVITADVLLTDGSYSSESEPDFSRIEMSYADFVKIAPIDSGREVYQPLVAKFKLWDKVHGIVSEESDLFESVDECENIFNKPKKQGISRYDLIIEYLKSGDKTRAINMYREMTGVRLAEAITSLEQIAAKNGIEITFSDYSTQKGYDAEAFMNLFGTLGLTPFTFIGGIFVLFFVNAAKEQNGGELTERGKRSLKKGVIGFFAYLAIILMLILFNS